MGHGKSGGWCRSEEVDVGCVWKEDGKSGGWCRMEEVNVGCVWKEGRRKGGCHFGWCCGKSIKELNRALGSFDVASSRACPPKPPLFTSLFFSEEHTMNSNCR